MGANIAKNVLKIKKMRLPLDKGLFEVYICGLKKCTKIYYYDSYNER